MSGYGKIAHEYVMCGTGRLFAKGISLQSAPKIIKQCALPGMWEYDFSNCHFTIIKQLAGGGHGMSDGGSLPREQEGHPRAAR